MIEQRSMEASILHHQKIYIGTSSASVIPGGSHQVENFKTREQKEDEISASVFRQERKRLTRVVYSCVNIDVSLFLKDLRIERLDRKRENH